MFIIVLLCVSLQRVLLSKTYKPYFDWFVPSYKRVESWFSSQSGWSPVGITVLFLGLFLLAYLVFYYIFSFVSLMSLGILGILINFMILWYYLDARPASGQSDVLVNQYQRIFGVLFWFVFLGPFATILYVELPKLATYLREKAENTDTALVRTLTGIQCAMDWLPVRLVGLIYALAMSSKAVLQYWIEHLFEWRTELTLVRNYGILALRWELNDEGLSKSLSKSVAEMTMMENMVSRALMIWVGLLGLYAFVVWFLFWSVFSSVTHTINHVAELM